MMMYGDSAIEEELEDLGDEFAAECAADSSVPGVSGSSSGTAIQQVYYSSSASSSSHSLVDHQQPQPFYGQGHHHVQQQQNGYEHRYAQVIEPQVQQQFVETNYNPTPHLQPQITQEFHQPAVRQQQLVIQQKYQQVHQPMSMYSNGGIYVPPQQHVYRQIEQLPPMIHQVKEPVIQQIFEPMPVPPAGVDPSMLPRARIINTSLPVPPIPPARPVIIQRSEPVRHKPQQQMMASSSIARQQQPQNNSEGVRVLRHRVVGRPVPTPVQQAPVAPVTLIVAPSSSSDPLPPPTVAPTPVVSSAETVMNVVASQQQMANGRSAPGTNTARSTLPPIPKKKKAADSTNVPLGTIASTEIAQAGAIQRIGTEEGWKSMNVWLKNADNEQKIAHLKDLLKQCLQASISVALLTSNDTPKFVRKLSKTHADSEIKSLSSQCVAKWKKEISAPSVPAPAKKAKKAKDTVVEEEEQKDVEMESSSTPSKSIDSKKRRLSSDENEKSKGSNCEKPKVKAKAKVYTAKSRLTGLVQDLGSGDVQPPEAKKLKKDEEPAGNKIKRSDTVAASPTSAAAVKKLPPIPKKVSAATMSSGFMDALAVNSEPKKKPLPKRKAPVEQKKSIVNDPLSSVLDSMGADHMRKVEPPRFVKTPTPPPAVVIPDDPVASPPGRRKIRFADECGKELIFIKEFEIEEGERINVNRMSPEDMKHHEMMMERKWKEDSGNNKIEDEEDETAPALPEVSWRMLPIDNLSCTTEHGKDSKEKEIEAKRRETALRAFNHPNFPSEITGDPEDYDPVAARLHVPPIIPLTSVNEPEITVLVQEAPVHQPALVPTPAAEEKKIVLPDNLKNLLDGLKKKGIVSDGPSPAQTTMSNLVPGLSSLGIFSNSATPSAPVIQQQQQQQMPAPQQQPQGMYGQPPQTQAGYGPQYGQEHQQQQPQYHQGPPPHQRHEQQPYPMDMGRERPMAGPSGGPRGPPESKICHMFAREGRCRFGNRCRFSHEVSGNFRGGDRRNDRGGRGRGGRGGDDRWRGGDDRRGGPYRNGPRRDWRDERDRRNFDGGSPPYQSPTMHSPSIRSPPVDGKPSEFSNSAIAIPSERVD